jgi:menaquinone-dependent protoporphyrinogen oxidase
LKVRVITASRHGSTAGIGRAIAERLRARGLAAEAVDASEAELPPLEDAVVLGSPIYMGKWMKDARRLMEELDCEPPGRRLFAFSVGPVGDPPRPIDAAAEDEVEMFVATRAESSRMFNGRIERAGLGRLERVALAAVHADDGDYREWERIEGWADEIAHRLGADTAGRLGEAASRHA